MESHGNSSIHWKKGFHQGFFFEEDSNIKKKNKNNKRNKKNKEVKYVNPGDAPGGSDDEEDTPRIRNPPSYISVYKQFITTVRQGHLEDDLVVYWEWKAG